MVKKNTKSENIQKIEETANNSNVETSILTLSDKTEVILKEPTTPQLIKSREIGNTPTQIYMHLISECCTFNGKTYIVPDIQKLRARDYLVVEATIRELIGEKN